MQITAHTIHSIPIAEINAEGFIIEKEEDGLDLLGNLYYQGFDRIILHEKNITPAFFDLKNRMAGEILQKFSNYRVRLAIVGGFFLLHREKHHGFYVRIQQWKAD